MDLIFTTWREWEAGWAKQDWSGHTALVSKAREEYQEWQNTLETEELIIILSSLS